MAKLQRYSSQAPIAVNDPVYVNKGAFQYTDAPAAAMSQQARSISEIGQTVSNTINVMDELNKKYQKHLDSILLADAGTALDVAKMEISAHYETNNDPTTYEDVTNKTLDSAEKKISKLLDKMSPEARAFAEQQLRAEKQTETVKMSTTRAIKTSKINYEKLSAKYEQYLADGNMDGANLVRSELETNWNEWSGDKESFVLILDKVKARGDDARKDAATQMAMNQVTTMIYSGAEAKDGKDPIDEYINGLKMDPVDKEKLFDYAKSVGDKNTIDKSDMAKAVMGEASTRWRKMYIEGTLTAKDIQEYQANVPNEYITQFDEVRDNWMMRLAEKNSNLVKGKNEDSPEAIKEIATNARLVRDGKMTIDEYTDVLDANVANLKTETFKSYYNGIDTLRADIHKNTFDYLDDIRDAEIASKGDADRVRLAPAISAKYAKLTAEIGKKIADRTPEEGLRIAQEILRPKAKEVSIGFFRGMSSGEIAERNYLETEGVKSIQETGMWDGWTKPTQEGVKTRLRNGEQPEDIILSVQAEIDKDNMEAEKKAREERMKRTLK